MYDFVSFLFISLHVPFSWKTCNTPSMSSILERPEVFTPRFSYGGCSRDVRWIPGRASMGPAISVLLPPGFHWICASVSMFLCGCVPYFWGIFPLIGFG